MKAYLAGGIDRRDDRGMTWRRLITPMLSDIGIEVYNPCIEENDIFEKHNVAPSELETTKKYNFEITKELGHDICERDISAIKKCDMMIVYYDRSVNLSSGTVSEMTLAKHIFKMPIYCIKKVSKKDIPLWTCGTLYSNVPEFKNLEECVSYIRKEHKNGI